VSFDLPLPAFHAQEPAVRSSDAGDYLLQLLVEAVPGVRVVAIARRPGVLSKVAVRGSIVSGDVVAELRRRLEGEHVQIIEWQREPRAYIAAALGLAEVPPMVLKRAIGHASVLLGEIDLRGMSGWRGINRILASTLTGWRIHLEPIAETAAWQSLAGALREGRTLTAHVVDAGRLEVHGLHAHIRGIAQLEAGAELQVRITRMDPDEGRITATRRLRPSGQLVLPNQ
jgi:transcription antitermination factor NusA-like protein